MSRPEGEHPVPLEHADQIAKAGMHREVGELVIVETTTLQLTIVEGETEWLDEVKFRSEVRAKSDDVARVRRDLRCDERDV